MEMNTRDYLVKALLDTQERVRDFMHYSEKLESKNLREYFRSYAESEGEQASQLQKFIEEVQ